jgi:hypothetical protein
VAALSGGLQIVDVSKPEKPIVRGSYGLPGHALGLAVSDGLAYVANGYGRDLQIVDVSNPSAPVLRGSCDIDGTARDVALSGAFAYVVNDHNALQIVDVSNPSAPVLRGGSSSPGEADAVVVSGNLAYLAGNYAMTVVDVSDPAAPVALGHCGVHGHTTDIAISNGLVYVASVYADSGIEGAVDVIDASNPSSLVFRGMFRQPASGVAVLGNRVYVACSGLSWNNNRDGLLILDVSNPATPVVLGNYGGGSTFDVAVLNDLAFVTGGLGAGLQVLDVSNPASPRPCGTYPAVGDIVLSDGLIYLACGGSGLWILRYTPLSAVRDGSWPLYR